MGELIGADEIARRAQGKRDYRNSSNTLALNPYGGLAEASARNPLWVAEQWADRAPQAGAITRDIFGGIFGSGGTDFGGIATDLLTKMQGTTGAERDVAYRGIDEEAGRATSNLSNRLGQFGNMDPEQFTRVAGDIDTGRIRARGEADARFAGMDRDMMLRMLQSLGPLMQAQQSASSDFGGVAMNILRETPGVLGNNGTGIGTGFVPAGRSY